MTVRTRVVNFRVTDEEFLRLKAASSVRKARCLSDFARSAILEAASMGEPASGSIDSLAAQLRAFERRLTSLESRTEGVLDALAGAGSLQSESQCVTNSEG